LLLEKTEIAAGVRRLEALAQPLPEGGRLRERLTGARVLSRVEARQAEQIQGGGLAPRLGKRPPEIQHVRVVFLSRPQIAQLQIQDGEAGQGLGLPAPV